MFRKGKLHFKTQDPEYVLLWLLIYNINQMNNTRLEPKSSKRQNLCSLYTWKKSSTQHREANKELAAARQEAFWDTVANARARENGGPTVLEKP